MTNSALRSILPFILVEQAYLKIIHMRFLSTYYLYFLVPERRASSL